MGYYLGVRHNWIDGSMLPWDFSHRWESRVDDQAQRLNQALEDSEQQFEALTLRIAELQARMVRLDAVGERLVDASGLNQSEFEFAQKPAVGGPAEADTDLAFKKPDFVEELAALSQEIEAREAQLEILQTLINGKKLDEEVFIAGRPVRKGWMSSRFGRRTDPFNGRIAMHRGVDFAAKDGSDIISVAAGVVTYADRRSGYGLLVEISHGNGYSTRYAHCKEILVSVGDVVKAGDTVALIGSTGRSTGPHVHFEVLRGNKQVDPARYIARKRSPVAG
jgi:murein DD-endopeptidase MepM/ murein hydrolase activator NlpD